DRLMHGPWRISALASRRVVSPGRWVSVSRLARASYRLCSEGPRYPRISGNHGNQNRTFDAIRHAVPANLELRKFSRLSAHLLYAPGRSPLLLFVYGRGHRQSILIAAPGRSAALRPHDHGFQPG